MGGELVIRQRWRFAWCLHAPRGATISASPSQPSRMDSVAASSDRRPAGDTMGTAPRVSPPLCGIPARGHRQRAARPPSCHPKKKSTKPPRRRRGGTRRHSRASPPRRPPPPPPAPAITRPASPLRPPPARSAPGARAPARRRYGRHCRRAAPAPPHTAGGTRRPRGPCARGSH